MKECNYQLGPGWDMAAYTVIALRGDKTFILGRTNDDWAAINTAMTCTLFKPGEIKIIYYDDATDRQFEVESGLIK